MKKIIVLLVIISQCFFKTTSEYIPDKIAKAVKPSNGIIEINRIGLKKFFVKDGNVDFGIVAISPSEFPDENNSMLILAGHSGSGEYAFFNDLYKLRIGDLATVIYNQSKYNYRLINIYYEEKDGKIKITKIKNTKSLVLVTCTNNRKGFQTVYVFKLVIEDFG